jgi:hypothetical protein
MIENMITLELVLPKTISINSLYSGKHWTYRKKVKDAYKKEVETALDGYDHYYAESIRIRIAYNSRLDVDNVVLVSKFVADTLVDLGYVNDDSPKYYKELRIKYDSEVSKNFCIVKVDLFNPLKTKTHGNSNEDQ